MKSIALLVLGLVGCGAAGGGTDTAPTDTATEVYVPWFTPTALEARDATVAAARRWSAATGLDIRVAPGGVPLTLVDEVTNPEHPLLHPEGITQYLPFTHILVRRTTPYGVDLVALHEIGHALGVHGELPGSPGIMNTSGDGRIHTEDLEAVCTVLACTAFVVEK